MNDDFDMEDVVELRNELEVTTATIQTIVNKLNQLIGREITKEECIEWCEEHRDALEATGF